MSPNINGIPNPNIPSINIIILPILGMLIFQGRLLIAIKRPQSGENIIQRTYGHMQ